LPHGTATGTGSMAQRLFGAVDRAFGQSPASL
jgi:hypothetical protein